MPSYNRSNLYSDLGVGASSVTNVDRIVNRAVREVISDVDLRSTKRKAYLSPALGEELFDYQAPADLKELAVIDIRRVEGRSVSDKFHMVQSDYFDRHKTYNKNLVCVEDDSFLKKLRISADLNSDDSQVTIHNMDSLTSNGTNWSAVLDASNLTLDSDIYYEGTGSFNFDMDQSGTTTTAGYIQTTTMTTKADLSDYENGGSVYLAVYIPGSTVDSDFDGLTLRIGSDASNYFSRTVTVTNENTSFRTGWNLVRFDFNAATETGTVDMDNIDYIRIAIDRGATGSMTTTDWRLDFLVARRGISHEVWYYTKYGWQNTSGTYLEDSTANTDLLNADVEEYQLFILKGKELLYEDQKEFDLADKFRDRYNKRLAIYKEVYPSERLQMIHYNRTFGTDYHREEMIW